MAQASGKLLLAANQFPALLAGLVAPPPVGVGHFGMPVQKAADRSPYRREDERQKQQAHHEEGDLRQDRNQQADDPERKEEDPPTEVPSLAAPPPARPARAGGRGAQWISQQGRPNLILASTACRSQCRTILPRGFERGVGVRARDEPVNRSPDRRHWSQGGAASIRLPFKSSGNPAHGSGCNPGRKGSGSPYGRQIEPVSRPKGRAQRSRLERAVQGRGMARKKPGVDMVAHRESNPYRAEEARARRRRAFQRGRLERAASEDAAWYLIAGLALVAHTGIEPVFRP